MPLSAPFPNTTRVGWKKLHAYCEVPLQGSEGFQYLIAHSKEFMTPGQSELVADGHFTPEEMFPELPHLIGPPPENDSWIYCLEEFKIGPVQFDGHDEFMKASFDHNSTWFSNFSELLAHCTANFGISAADFKNQWETRIPNW